ncbi:hypothetical protein B0181_05750 [Moraxella caviae]|uniref:8-oxo-dGTP diphosphatase n=1 Tax=Moraxella caviae TaxID=34060 RepID=A0A1T0A2J2_9GAMM|nr:NUDIX domain-containing protein [Moraxella caviae]OOR89915.1 hypothetical protein B0181_05750 [Moraxella caviae]STZ14297.1 8-oxo-dGTP diphosphatase [Moraxella caviae]VEW12254.1 8-oxo-dGTP diphosphatase [Moraxella caviae]
MKEINVAVAVLCFDGGQLGDEFLVAKRLMHQHQGGKLEFVGGKIEPNETARSALVREVAEELGLDISANLAVRMGVIRHEYTDDAGRADKKVALHVFKVMLDLSQYKTFKNQQFGKDGQVLSWLSTDELHAKKDEFPAANARIFEWLKLPQYLAISQPLANFTSVQQWAEHYAKVCEHRQNAPLYVRLQASISDERAAIEAVAKVTAGGACRLIVPLSNFLAYQDKLSQAARAQIVALKLNHDELMTAKAQDLVQNWAVDLPILASCHDAPSIQKANALASLSVAEGRGAGLVAILLSPVLPTATHPEAAGLGFERFGELAGLSDVPVFALGGLKPDDLAQCQAYGAWGVSGIRGFGG